MVIQHNIVTCGFAHTNTDTADFHGFLPEGGQEMTTWWIICQHSQVACIFSTDPAGQYGHIGGVHTGIEFVSKQLGVKYVVTQSQQFHYDTSFKILLRPYSAGNSWDDR